MGRAPCCEKVGLKKGRWTAEEDDILVKYIATHGEGSWRSMPKNAGLLRCGKSCRLRWINYLRADVKRGNITAEEEETIIKLHASLGNRWSVIAGHLPGRTDNEIKNYWNSHLSRKIDCLGHSGSGSKPVEIDLSKVASKRKGGRPSRSAAKKNQHTTSREQEKSEQEESMVIDSDPQQASSSSGSFEPKEDESNPEPSSPELGPVTSPVASDKVEGGEAQGMGDESEARRTIEVRDNDSNKNNNEMDGEKVVDLKIVDDANKWLNWEEFEGLEGMVWDSSEEAWPMLDWDNEIHVFQ